MTYKDLKVIDSSWIDERIVELQGVLFGVTLTDETIRYNSIDAKIKLLEAIKLELIDATPILEKAYNTGYTKCYYKSFSTTQKPGFEELLNTEVKLLNNE